MQEALKKRRNDTYMYISYPFLYVLSVMYVMNVMCVLSSYCAEVSAAAPGQLCRREAKRWTSGQYRNLWSFLAPAS